MFPSIDELMKAQAEAFKTTNSVATTAFDGARKLPATITGLKYNEVSQSFWNATHEVLSGRTNGTDAVKKLEGRLK